MNEVKHVTGAAFAIAGLIFMAGGVAKAGDLSSDATNPAAALIQLQFQDLYTPNSHGVNGAANSFIVQPVYPIVLGPDYYFQSIITRTTIPWVTTAKVSGAAFDKHRSGLGDTTVLVVPVHKRSTDDQGGFMQWGPVLPLVIPTATTTFTGSGQWQAGIGGLLITNNTKVFNDGDSLLLGVLGYNLWSFAATRSTAADVDKAFFQPLITYHFESLFGQKGWYTGSPDDLWVYDWNASQLTQAPIGLKLGKVFALGDQPINVFGQSWWNAVSPKGSPEWTAKLNVTLLFPE